MKVDGITLLQMINNNQINSQMKIYINYEETNNRKRMNGEIEYLVYKNGNLFTNGKRIKIWDCMGIEYFLRHEFEIIEEDKPIEKLMQLDTRETSDCIIKIQDKINELIDEVNKLKKEKENE